MKSLIEEFNFRCHPEAIKFVSNFNPNKQLLLDKLYKLFNDKAFGSSLPANMAITWNPRLTKTAGVCVQVTVQVATMLKTGF